MRKLVLLLVGFALVVAACGGGDEETTGTEPTTETVGTAVDAATEPTVASAGDTMAEEDATAGDAMTDDAMTDDAMTDDAMTDDGEAESPAPTEPEPEPIDAVVTLRALGPVRIGMTVDEAAGEAGVELRRDFGRQSTSTCYYVTAAALLGVSIMVVDDEIARIDVDSPSTIATRSGVRIGTPVDNLRQVYPNNIRQANDAVAEGEALAFVPNDDFDADYRIYFEIEDGQVARYRLGTKPAVDYLGGCPAQ